MTRLLFLTCANRPYEHFALPYACAALQHVADSKVEIGVESADEFNADNADGLRILQKHFPGRLLIRDATFKGIVPNTVRFVMTPETEATYTYIGDIDIIVLDSDLIEFHEARMAEYGLPYSNMVRPYDPTRLTGLHFTVSKQHFPLPDISDLDLSTMNDERVLCEIVRRKGMPIKRDLQIWRPGHGIHMSPNRPAVRAHEQVNKRGDPMPDWGLFKEDKKPNYLRFAATPAFMELRPLLPAKFLSCLEKIEQAYAE